jgi:hypothetical protein
MDCPLCGVALAERGFFCKACAAQVRCKVCREVLEVDALACVECGARVSQAPEGDTASAHSSQAIALDAHRNTLSYHETKSNRTFSASLTDTAIQGLGDSLGGFLLPRGSAKAPITAVPFTKTNLALPIAPQKPADLIAPLANGNAPATPIDNKERILKLFHPDGDGFELRDNRLKAKSQSDYYRRLTYLFLYAHELHGRPSTAYDDVRKIEQVAKVWDTNTRFWLGKKVGFTVDAENRLKLNATGREDAVKALDDALNPDLPDQWNPDKKVVQKRKPRKKS